MTRKERAQGSMIGGAYGDSLGAAVEFMSSKKIKKEFGDQGITELVPVYGEIGNITDDTQMAIATAEGILNTPQGFTSDQNILIQNIWHSYLKWFDTQFEEDQARAPGSTCLKALGSGAMGTVGKSLNKSPGCGAIMRVHPVGLAISDPDESFELGMASGAITHGHPDAYIPAGFLSSLTSEIMNGREFINALDAVHERLKKLPRKKAQGTLRAIEKAVSTNNVKDTFETIDNEVGGTGGWAGHDALGIGIFAVIQANQDPLEAVRIAVNHSGDSDSTGSIAGVITGAIHGSEMFIKALEDQDVTLEHEDYLDDLAAELSEVPMSFESTS